jgi:hypothetical protein
MRRVIGHLTDATTWAALTLYGGLLLIGASGPGGVEFEAQPPPARPAPSQVPLDRLAFPHCTTESSDQLWSTVVVVNDWGIAHEVPFARAWRINHDEVTHNNVPVIGFCADQRT